MEAYILKSLFLIAIAITTEARKYDIEYEAIKLYGRNVSGILDRFRRSSDYVKILNNKVKELSFEMTDVYYQTYNYCQKQMRKKVFEIFGLNLTASNLAGTTSTTTLAPAARHGGRQGVNETVPQQKRIERIDTYSKLTSSLTFKEIIKFKDLGFKTAGICIRIMRESMPVIGEQSVDHNEKQAVSAVSEGNNKHQTTGKIVDTTYKIYSMDEDKAKTTDESNRIKLWHPENTKKESSSTSKLYANTAAPRSMI